MDRGRTALRPADPRQILGEFGMLLEAATVESDRKVFRRGGRILLRLSQASDFDAVVRGRRRDLMLYLRPVDDHHARKFVKVTITSSGTEESSVNLFF